MSIHRFRYFVAAAEEGSFIRAAERLHVAPSALSRQIHALEDNLGAELFIRQGRSVQLSRVGHFYLERIRKILEDIKRADEDLQSFSRGETGQLRIGLHELSAAQDVIVQSLKTFASRFPACDLNVEPMLSALQVEGLQTGMLDLGFVLDCPDDLPGIGHARVDTSNWKIALPADHDLAPLDAISLDQLAGERFVGLRKYVAPAVYERLMQYCATRGLYPNYVQYAQSAHGLFALVAIGIGIAFVNTPVVVPPHVVLRDIRDCDLDISLDVIWRQDDQRALLHNLLGLVRDQARVKLGSLPA